MKTIRHDSFAAYVLPSVLAFALSGLYTIVDGFFIGQSLGDLGLAAITLAYPAAALLQAVGTGIGLAGAIRCTILQARGEEQTPRTCFSGTVLLLLATSAVFTAVLLAFRRTRRAGLAMALALGLYMLAGHCALKPLFARPRPCDLRPEMLTLVARPHGWSFPSGHTSSAFAAAFALWLQNRRLGVPALALAGFIGFTRMYLYVHFPTDILGGVALGLALGACGSLLADKISNKWAKRSEVKRTV